MLPRAEIHIQQVTYILLEFTLKSFAPPLSSPMHHRQFPAFYPAGCLQYIFSAHE